MQPESLLSFPAAANSRPDFPLTPTVLQHRDLKPMGSRTRQIGPPPDTPRRRYRDECMKDRKERQSTDALSMFLTIRANRVNDIHVLHFCKTPHGRFGSCRRKGMCPVDVVMCVVRRSQVDSEVSVRPFGLNLTRLPATGYRNWSPPALQLLSPRKPQVTTDPLQRMATKAA